MTQDFQLVRSGRDNLDQAQELHEVETKTLESFVATLTLAGLKPTHKWQLVNQYGSVEYRGSWWLFKTTIGLIRLGWRHRVIEIDYSQIPVNESILDEEDTDVTEDRTRRYAHAWTDEKCLSYLKNLRDLAEKDAASDF